ncbi:MAG TPA: metallophosphoesterase [Lachnospiraceae bacterium]|nr:metallophosphoesterase [Lachnospiraceae bacterium]
MAQQQPKLKKKTRRLLVFLLIILLLCIPALDSRLRVVTYTITTSQVSSPVRLVLLTDLHSCSYGKNESTLLAAIDEQAPDVILLGGDIFDDVLPDDCAIALLDGICQRYPVYFVVGNHEYWSGRVTKMLDILQQHNVTILSGDYECITVNGTTLNICGVTDPDNIVYTDSNDSIYEQLNRLRSVSENGFYTILLAHRPEYIEAYQQQGFDLVLSGHAHGGQWRIPGILNGLYAPNQGLFPEFAGGLYYYEDTTMIVSRGLARETTLIPRIFNRPELVVIDLQKPPAN